MVLSGGVARACPFNKLLHWEILMDQMKKLGEIFVEKNILCPNTVDRIVAISVKLNKRFGTVLEEMGLVTGEELALALARQYNCKTIFNFTNNSVSKQALDLIPSEVALQHRLFPLKLQGDILDLAITDPTNVKIVQNIATNNKLKIIPYVSTSKDINLAICKHYFGKEIIEPSGRTILIVEDDKIALALLVDMLSKHYKVFTAPDGYEGFKEAISKKPHVVLTDKEMPKLDGFGLLSALRAVPETKQIPIILLSGTTSDEEEVQVFEKGFFDYISKPVKLIPILTRVKRAFDYYENQNYMFLR
jgi:CheY-like chemotaxis protein